jgi:K+-transporting ATPase c subunit
MRTNKAAHRWGAELALLALKRKNTLMKRTIIAILVMWFLAGCAQATPAVDVVGTAVAQKISQFTPYPTYTLQPTYTYQPTYTSMPTYTPQPPIVVTATSSPTPLFTPTDTSTPTITPTPTKTPTSTPTPNATKTQQAIINATKGADATATKAAAYAQATKMAQYQDITNKELQSYAEQHTGEKVRIKGRVFNIVGTTELQMYYGWTYDAVFVRTAASFTGLYENNFITVYGTVGGNECFKNAYNADICQPLIEDAFFTK